MALIHAYVRFNGNAKQAFEFYQSCLGGDLSVTTIGKSPMAAYMPPAMKDQVFHAQLQQGDLVLLGSDMVPEEGLVRGNSVMLTLECASKDETHTLFTKLSEGGKIGHDLVDQPFGFIGDFADQFGVEWFVVFTGSTPNT